MNGPEILIFCPTYAPDVQAIEDPLVSRPYHRLSQEQLAERINGKAFLSRIRPWVYMDVIDSILNINPGADLVVADARSSDSIRKHLKTHQEVSRQYYLALFDEKESQWKALNTIINTHARPETKYVVYTSSDIVFTHDWIAEALKEMEADSTLQILFPCVSQGDPNLPCQIATGPRDLPLIDPPYQEAARAHVLNGYAFIMRMEFIKTYGGYPTIFRNCFTESFLYYMCEAMGGKMRLMPRGWVYHHGSVDVWDGDGTGDMYKYKTEKPDFDRIMDELQKARVAERPYMSVSFLKELLYA